MANRNGATGRLYPWLVVVFLIVLYTSNYLDRQILGLMVKPIRADLHINDTQYSLLAGLAFSVLYSFSAIPLGYVVDNGSRRMLITVAVFTWSVMTALCGVANSFAGLFVARLGVGIGEAPLSPSSYSLLTDMIPKEALGRALSAYALGIPIGSGIALIVGGTLVDTFTGVTLNLPLIGEPKPWQMVFFVIGLPGILLAALVPMIIREPARHVAPGQTIERPGLPTVFRYMWQRRDFYFGFFVGSGFAPIAFYGYAAWMPSFLQRVYDYSAKDAGLLLGGTTVILGIPGGLVAGWAADRMISRGRADGHVIVSAIYLVGVFVCGSLGPLMPMRAVSMMLIAGLGFFNFTWAGVYTALLQVNTPARMRGQVSAVYLFIAGIMGLGIGPTAVGAVTDYVFARDGAVGDSMALVGTIALAIAMLGLWGAKRGMAKGPV